jgi:hypothetical protein
LLWGILAGIGKAGKPGKVIVILTKALAFRIVQKQPLKGRKK